MSKPTMTYRYLGGTGIRVSVLSLGAWGTYGVKADQEACTECMRIAFENGINFFDNAEVYGTNTGDAELLMGESLKQLNWKRQDYVISTKLFWGGKGHNIIGLSRKHLIEGMESSLKRLQLDYVDIVYAHRPDIGTPMEEIVRGFSHLVQTGKAYYWGTSEWTSQQITEAYWIAKMNNLVPPSVEQPQYSMFVRDKMEHDYLPIFRGPYKIGTTIWSPLNSGILTGKYNKGIPEGSRLAQKGYDVMLKKNLDNVPKVIELEEIAKKIGCSVGNLAIAWCTINQNVSTVILGASNPKQLVENLESLSVIPKLTPDILAEIEKILKNKPEEVMGFGREPNPHL